MILAERVDKESDNFSIIWVFLFCAKKITCKSQLPVIINSTKISGSYITALLKLVFYAGM